MLEYRVEDGGSHRHHGQTEILHGQTLWELLYFGNREGDRSGRSNKGEVTTATGAPDVPDTGPVA